MPASVVLLTVAVRKTRTTGPTQISSPSASSTAAELNTVSHEYRCVVTSPGEPKDYLAVINEALAERAKQSPADHKK